MSRAEWTGWPNTRTGMLPVTPWIEGGGPTEERLQQLGVRSISLVYDLGSLALVVPRSEMAPKPDCLML